MLELLGRLSFRNAMAGLITVAAIVVGGYAALTGDDKSLDAFRNILIFAGGYWLSDMVNTRGPVPPGTR